MEEKKKKFVVFEWIEWLFEKISNGFYWILKNCDVYIYFLVVTAIAIAVRILLFSNVSQDLRGFIFPWYEQYLDGSANLGTQIGDYTPAYNYFLYILTIFKIEPGSDILVNNIKILSCLFDLGIAIYASLLVYKMTNNKVKMCIAYATSIMGITVFLNSAWWGQCDSIYAFFIIASIYYFLTDHQRTSMIMFSMAFIFKLQSIFVLPVFLIAWFRKEYKFRYFIWIPIIYFVSCVPACIYAESFWGRMGECFKVYFNQSANSYSQLTLNCGTFYSIIFRNFESHDGISKFATLLAITVVGTFMFSHYRRKEKYTKETYFKLFAFYSLLVPFMLPHMHDRYYYLSEILLPLYAVIFHKKFYIAILSYLNSLIGYMAYLFNVSFFEGDSSRSMSFRIGALLCLCAICLLAVDIYQDKKAKEIPMKVKEQE